ncbi:hypothetical protein [Mycobacterium sp.]|uniref:hypothetical protein n=1 Tax=Mycobacterium sp. TaxID=1785 RepID=UPI003D13973C
MVFTGVLHSLVTPGGPGVFVENRPGAAWIHRGEVKVTFDFTVEAGQVRRLQFRADADVLAGVRRRERGSTR